MGKNKSASGLTNFVQYDNQGNIFFVSGSNTLMSISSSGAITTTGVISGSNAATASSVANLNQNVQITGSLGVTSTITAQTLVVQTVTSSVVYSSGSNIFGNTLSNTQQMTGSVLVTGSFSVATTGTELLVTASGVRIGNALTDAHIVSGSLAINPSGLFVSSSGNVGIGTTSVINKLQTNVSDSTTYTTASLGNILTLYNTSLTTGGYAGIDFISEPTTGNSGRAAINMTVTGNGTSDLAFSTRNNTMSEKMRITSAGNIGMGTSSPSSRLDVRIASEAVGSGAVALIAGTSNGANDIFRWFDGTTQLGVFKNSGNVGIGTSNPSRRLTVPSDGSNWITGVFGGAGGSDVVVVGNLSGPTIGGHNSTLTAWAPLLLNPDGGNVGIGTRSPSQILDIRDSFQDYTSGQFNQIIYSTTAQSPGRGGSIGLGGVFTGTSVVSFGAVVGAKENATDNNTAGYLGFLTRANAGPITEKMRITSGGNVLVGQSTADISSNGWQLQAVGGGHTAFAINNNEAFIFNNRNTGTTYQIDFRTNSIERGAINVTDSGTTYTTTSDYRVKEDFKDFSGLDKLTNIKVYDFKFKDLDERMDGVIAHELQEVLPYAVYGEKDGAKFQGVDYSRIVPVLIKAIQELKTELDAAKAEIEILKTK